MSQDTTSGLQARKELLLARSAIERLELSAHLHRLKQATAPSALLKSVWPRFTGGGGVDAAWRTWRVLRRYPIVSSAVSMVLPRLLSRNLFRIAKLGAGAFAVYQGIRLWKDVRKERPRRPPREDSPASGQDPG